MGYFVDIDIHSGQSSKGGITSQVLKGETAYPQLNQPIGVAHLAFFFM